MPRNVLGIIGGSGLYALPDLEFRELRTIPTPFGAPSDALLFGSLHGTEIVFLARHGAGHRLMPGELPYQANIYALKSAGVTHLLTVSAVGSLQPHFPPCTVVLPDQIIDRTLQRPRTFFGNGIVAHVGMADPFCQQFRHSIATAAASIGVETVPGGTYVCIEGPQFSTRAESELFRSWNAAVIGMTAMPEARLAREAELCYATLAMVTDFDVWHESEGDVSVELVIANLHRNTDVARAIVVELARSGLPSRDCACTDALENAIITDRSTIGPEVAARLGVIGERYLTGVPAS